MPGRICIIVTLTLIALCQPASAEDWPWFRGPNYDGLSSEKGFQPHWTDNTPPNLWERTIGPAFSGISIVDGKCYTCGTENGQQVMFCLNADTGEILWQKPFEKEYKEGQGGDGTRTTPTVDAGRVYILGGDGHLVCFDANTGSEIWDKTFTDRPYWGYSGSVIIDGDNAIVIGGGDDGAVQAFKKDTGELVWQGGEGSPSYATPLPFTYDEHRYIAAPLAKKIVILDAQTGEQVWNMAWETSWDVNAATPIFHDDRLFWSSGYKHGSMEISIHERKEEKPYGKEVVSLRTRKRWSNDNLRAKFQTPVLYEGNLYTSDEVGLKCVDFKTGELRWQQRGNQHGTVIIADGYLIVLTERGRLQIGQVSTTGFRTLTDAQLMEGRHWTVPTLHNQRIYVRNLEKIACYELTGK